MQILNEWRTNLNVHFTEINELLNESKSIGKSYEKSKKEKSDIGFNVFSITSDLYYRENFHSDIIKALLDPKEKHNQNTKFLYLFIDLLNKVNTSTIILEDNYKNVNVAREQSNIDILITDETTKRAIIIENKINNAVDMNRQLPRYYNEVKKNYFVDAIVYLTLDSSKRPDKHDWTKDELTAINYLLKIIPSFDRHDRPNIYKDWLLPAIIESNDIDSTYLLRQYATLLKFLNTNYMDTVSLEKFYEILKEKDNLKTSISIKNMLNELPEYLAIRIEDKYKNNCYPFQKIWRYKLSDTVFEAFQMENLYLKLDVWCGDYGYKAIFWNPQNENYDIKEDFKDFDILRELEYDNGKKYSIVKHFSLFEEELLFSFIDQLIDILKKKITNS